MVLVWDLSHSDGRFPVLSPVLTPAVSPGSFLEPQALPDGLNQNLHFNQMPWGEVGESLPKALLPNYRLEMLVHL